MHGVGEGVGKRGERWEGMRMKGTERREEWEREVKRGERAGSRQTEET